MGDRAKQLPPQLLLLDGPSGVGKSTLLHHLRATHRHQVEVGSKFTTRGRRRGDNDWEFQFVERIPAKAAEYAFRSVENEYAFDAEAASSAAEAGKIYCVTCTDGPTTAKLKKVFSVVTIYVFRPLTGLALHGILASRGSSRARDAAARRIELAEVGPDYIAKIHLIDHVILNVASEAMMCAQLDVIVGMYTIAGDSPLDESRQ